MIVVARLAYLSLILIVWTLASAEMGPPPGRLSRRPVHVIQVDAAINPATSDYIHDEIDRAKTDGAECLVIRLNTPGGLLKSTRAIVTDPTILVADEPTGDLDKVSAEEVMKLLERLNSEFKKTIVMVTHDPRAAERAHLVRHLDKGELS